MKKKNLVKYLAYILLIFGLLYLDSYILRQKAVYQKETFDVGLAYILMSMIIKIGVGAVLGLDYIFSEIKKVGSWKINLPKMILMVIPSLYFSMSFFAMYRFVENPIYKILVYPMFIFFENDSSFIIVSQLMLGYLFITSFYKQSKEIKS